MIKNLSEYFKSEQEIFLESINYKKIERSEENSTKEITLVCQDNVKASVNEKGIRIILTRSLTFRPEELFELSVSFGADLQFNERKPDYDWNKIDLAGEFRENGDFIIVQLMSRISLLIGQITSSFGQPPFILPAELIKKK